MLCPSPSRRSWSTSQSTNRAACSRRSALPIRAPRSGTWSIYLGISIRSAGWTWTAKGSCCSRMTATSPTGLPTHATVMRRNTGCSSRRRPDDQQLQTWRRGVVLPDGYRTAPAEVSTAQPSGKGMWLRVVLKEGRKRQIRETGSTLGLPVVKIIRVRIGSLYLGELKPRQWRALSADEVKDLQSGKKPIAVPRRRPPRAHTRQADTASQNRPATSRPSDKRESTHRTSSKGTSPKGAPYGRSSSGRPPSARGAHPRPSSGKPLSRRKPTGGKPSDRKAHPSPQKTGRSKKP